MTSRSEAGGAGGFARDELGGYAVCGFGGFACEFAEEEGGGEGAHGFERLADGGEAGDVEGGGFDVVVAEDGDVFGDAEAGVVEGADGADGGDVVEAEDGGEGGAGGEEFLDAGVSDFG